MYNDNVAIVLLLLVLPNCRYCGTATRFEKTKPTSNLNLFPHTKTEDNNGRNTNSSENDQNEYFLMLILVPLMIGLGNSTKHYNYTLLIYRFLVRFNTTISISYMHVFHVLFHAIYISCLHLSHVYNTTNPSSICG